MKKRIFCLSMAVLMLLTSVFSLASCMGGGTTTPPPAPPAGETCEHKDARHDGECDMCGEKVEIVHVDDDHNGRCDVCKKKGLKVTHTDANKDNTCDVCEAVMPHTCADADNNLKCDICFEAMPVPEHDCVDTNSDLYCDVCFEEMPIAKCAQCTDSNSDNVCDTCKSEVNCPHVDANKDTACDDCDAYVKPEKADVDYPWAKTNIVMQLTKNTNGEELYAVSDKYLSGELDDGGDVSKQVRLRNMNAATITKVEVQYLYYPDTTEYGWGSCISKVETAKNQGGDTAPDIWCLFVYDMVGASLKGCFANLLNVAGREDNYFEFNGEFYNAERNDLGYMWDYMTSLSLAPEKKLYVLSSDYFIDMVRAFFCIPVSIELMEDNGEDIVALNAAGMKVHTGGDRNDDGEFNIEDFYELVKAGEWTYDRIAQFSEAVYKRSSTNSGACNIGDDIVGFAIDTGGLAASGLLYTSSVTIIERNDTATGKDRYNYPKTNAEFTAFSLKAKELFGETTGVCVVNKDMNYKEYGAEGHLAIRKRFSENKVLFGDITLVGALEFAAYQNMKATTGFGIVPVPVYKDNDEYLTAIHNMGSCGAITINTEQYAQCTAFLNYQSTNSEKVLNDYYKYNVQYGLATDSEGTVEMLDYLRNNVRSSFDKAMEDAIGVYMPGAIKWHNELSSASYQIDISSKYETYYGTKEGQLDSLADAFLTFQD